MKKDIETTLLEMFGEPIEPIYGTKVGDVKDIKKVGAVGPRDLQAEDMMVCSACGTMPIDGECDCDHSDKNDEGLICPGCGMMVIDGQCGCEHDDVCPSCKLMPPRIGSSCGCELKEISEKVCAECGMREDKCDCAVYEGNSCAEPSTSDMPNPGDYATQTLGMMTAESACLDEPSKINEPSEDSVANAAGVSETNCRQCGMKEGTCGCMNEERRGPSKSTLKKIFKGDKTFDDKVDTAKGMKGIDDPKAFAAYATKKITGKYPSQD